MNQVTAPGSPFAPRLALAPGELQAALVKHYDFVSDRPGGIRLCLQNRDFTTAPLNGMSLVDADLTGSTFQGADLRGTDFTGAILTGANFAEANLKGAILRKADLKGTSFRGANLTMADLTSADMREVRIVYSDKAVGLRQFNRQLAAAELSGANLRNAILRNAQLSEITAERTDFTNACMRGARLIRANLKAAVLIDANLENADLESANLANADLSGAILIRTHMDTATIDGARLDRILTTKAVGTPISTLNHDIEELLQDHERWLNTSGREGKQLVLSGYDLRGIKSLSVRRLSMMIAQGAILYAVDLSGAEMLAANLTKADLRDANLAGTDLRGARLTHAKLARADMHGANMTALPTISGTAIPACLDPPICVAPISQPPTCAARTSIRRTS